MSDSAPPSYYLLCDSGPLSTDFYLNPLEERENFWRPQIEIRICGKARDSRFSALRIVNTHGEACAVTGIHYDINSPCKPVMPEKPVRGVLGSVASLRFEDADVTARGHKALLAVFFKDLRRPDDALDMILYLVMPVKAAATAKKEGGLYLAAACVPPGAMPSIHEKGIRLEQTFVAPGCTITAYGQAQVLLDIGGSQMTAHDTNAHSAAAAAGAADPIIGEMSSGAAAATAAEDTAVTEVTPSNGMDGVGIIDVAVAALLATACPDPQDINLHTIGQGRPYTPEAEDDAEPTAKRVHMDAGAADFP